MTDQPRAPRDIVEHVLNINNVPDAYDVAQEVVNEFTDAEVAYFALYRGMEVEPVDDAPVRLTTTWRALCGGCGVGIAEDVASTVVVGDMSSHRVVAITPHDCPGEVAAARMAEQMAAVDRDLAGHGVEYFLAPPCPGPAPPATTHPYTPGSDCPECGPDPRARGVQQ